jgi:hypothetical protein
LKTAAFSRLAPRESTPPLSNSNGRSSENIGEHDHQALLKIDVGHALKLYR